MSTNIDDKSGGAVKARERLAAKQRGLISDIRESDVFPEYDPWPLAALRYKLEKNGYRIENKQEWTRFHDLHREYNVALETRGELPILFDPVMQLMKAENCFELAEFFESDPTSILEALANCLTHGLRVPSWIASAFVERYLNATKGVCLSWADPEAFGDANPPDPLTKIRPRKAGIIARNDTAYLAYWEGVELLVSNPSEPIGVEFYEKIAEEIGVKSAAYVQELIDIYLGKSYYFNALVDVKKALLLGVNRHEAVERKTPDELALDAYRCSKQSNESEELALDAYWRSKQSNEPVPPK
jgi:hypothetical protein